MYLFLPKSTLWILHLSLQKAAPEREKLAKQIPEIQQKLEK